MRGRGECQASVSPPPSLLPSPFQRPLPLSLWWGRALGSDSPTPCKPCWSTEAARTPPPAHASFPDPRRQSSGTSSSASQSFHCFQPRWERARNNVSRCQHPSLPAGNDSVCMEARPLGWCANSKIWPQISLLPLPSERPLPQNRHEGSVEVFLEFFGKLLIFK